ncbi:MAG TPA: IS3 family transposase [Pedobacter sp.]
MYGFIFSHASFYPVVLLCSVLEVSRSAYYSYRSGTSYQLSGSKKEEETAIVNSFLGHRRRYGVRRLVPELAEQGFVIGNYKIRKVLQKHGLKAIQPRSFVPRTTDSRHPYFISPNLLPDNPFPAGINLVIVGDITYIPLIAGTWAYLSVWLDLYSRKVIGWSLADHMREELVVHSFKKVLNNRSLSARTIIHSDRGGQYAGKLFRNLLDKNNLSQSMSRADNPYDNAFMESYFSRFKAEMLEGGTFECIEDARTEIFDYIEMYYNPKRRHSALGYRSPVDFEKANKL